MKEMKIEIFSRSGVENFKTDMPHVVISVRDPGSKEAKLPVNPNRIAELYLDFSDFDGKRLNVMFEHELKTFSKEDAKAILSLIKLSEPYINMIVVNCEAGICRSSAIGAALSILLDLPGKDTRFFNPRGPYYPNRFVYRMILDTAMEEGWDAPKN